MVCVALLGGAMLVGGCGSSVPAGNPVKTMKDLEARYVSDVGYRWKVLPREKRDVADPDGWFGRVRLEGPGEDVWFDRECRARISGEFLEVEILDYEAKGKLSVVKLFKITNSKHMTCVDPKIFPGNLEAR